MKNRIVRSLCLLGLAGILTVGFQNCGNVHSSNAPVTNNSQGTVSGGGSCSLQTLTVPIKTLFVVDVSGSNATGQGSVPATDPNKVFRGGSITDFFNLYQAKTNFIWGFDVFSNDSAESYINGNFGNASAMQSAIQEFDSEQDGGGTPYIAALNFAQSQIASDPDIHSTATHPPIYNIIFMSDGYPDDPALTGNFAANEATIDSAISKIIALAPNRIFLSAVYYGTVDDPNAAGLIQNMAATGGGQFVNADTSSTSTIPVSYLITVPQGDCQ